MELYWMNSVIWPGRFSFDTWLERSRRFLKEWNDVTLLLTINNGHVHSCTSMKKHPSTGDLYISLLRRQSQPIIIIFQANMDKPVVLESNYLNCKQQSLLQQHKLKYSQVLQCRNIWQWRPGRRRNQNLLWRRRTTQTPPHPMVLKSQACTSLRSVKHKIYSCKKKSVTKRTFWDQISKDPHSSVQK